MKNSNWDNSFIYKRLICNEKGLVRSKTKF